MANTRIIKNPALNRLPKNDREMSWFAQELAEYIFSTLDEMPGRLASQRNIPMVRVGNRGSVQSANPLSATAGATATITIASHTLTDETGAISYGSGTITGLTHDQLYYVYADDPTYAGGTVSYLSSTDPATNLGAAGRYYVGSVTTPRADDSATITNVTQANPGVVTAANTFQNGDEVDITGVVGMTELNGNRYTVANRTASQFELSGTDTTGFTAYVSDGTAALYNPDTSGGGGGGGGGVGDDGTITRWP